MLPDKSIAALVKYYYSWKKTRTRTSLMDRQARKLQAVRDEGRYGEDAEEGSEEEGDKEVRDIFLGESYIQKLTFFYLFYFCLLFSFSLTNLKRTRLQDRYPSLFCHLKQCLSGLLPSS
jgi:hypothetical protein